MLSSAVWRASVQLYRWRQGNATQCLSLGHWRRLCPSRPAEWLADGPALAREPSIRPPGWPAFASSTLSSADRRGSGPPSHPLESAVKSDKFSNNKAALLARTRLIVAAAAVQLDMFVAHLSGQICMLLCAQRGSRLAGAPRFQSAPRRSAPSEPSGQVNLMGSQIERAHRNGARAPSSSSSLGPSSSSAGPAPTNSAPSWLAGAFVAGAERTLSCASEPAGQPGIIVSGGRAPTG